MNRLLLKVAISAMAGLFWSSTAAAQLLPPAKKTARVQITQEPALELARGDFAIIRWTTNNPGGSDEHFGVIHYGTDPNQLNQIAKSPIRLNRAHPKTIFRVRVGGLKPQTTYYYTVTSMESNGKNDGEKSPVRQFTTPGPAKDSSLILRNSYSLRQR